MPYSLQTLLHAVSIKQRSDIPSAKRRFAATALNVFKLTLVAAMTFTVAGCSELIDSNELRVTEDAPRSNDFDTDEASPNFEIFEDADDAAEKAKTAATNQTNPFDDLSIGVNSRSIESATDATVTNDDSPNEKTQGDDTATTDADLSRFYEGDAQHRESMNEYHGQWPPPLEVSDWMNSDPIALADLKGKIVVLDFWATWCGPCMRAVPHTNDLAQKYADDVVFIGVCSARGAEKMAATVKKYDIQYPVAADVGSTIKQYGVNGYPDYFIIGRDGKVKIADCKNSSVEAAIKTLLGGQAVVLRSRDAR